MFQFGTENTLEPMCQFRPVPPVNNFSTVLTRADPDAHPLRVHGHGRLEVRVQSEEGAGLAGVVEGEALALHRGRGIPAGQEAGVQGPRKIGALLTRSNKSLIDVP